jgi:hypothetical protein
LDEEVGSTRAIKESPICREDPTTLNYLRRYDMESAYLAPRGPDENIKAYKTRLYTKLHTIMRAMAGDHEMRVNKMATHRMGRRVGQPE